MIPKSMFVSPESESLLERSLPFSQGWDFVNLRTNQEQEYHKRVTKTEAYTREPQITVAWLL